MENVVRYVPLEELHPFADHPFCVRDDSEMDRTVESIRQFGVLNPGIVRPRKEGGYEIISGHRRKRACELAGLSEMPVIVRELDRDTAVITMVDTNLQRESILPSERAKAYKMKLEAIRHQGKAASPQLAARLRTDDEIGGSEGISGDTVRRYIRLNELVPELLQMVDEGRIGLTPAVEISFLKPEEQRLLVDTIDSEQATPSLSQAMRMRQLSKLGALNEDTMLTIVMEQKKHDSYSVVIPGDKLRKYFPRTYTPERIQDTILKLLDAWQQRRDQNKGK